MRPRLTVARVAVIVAAVLAVVVAATSAWAYRAGFVDLPGREPFVASVVVDSAASAVAFVGVSVVPMDREGVLADQTVVVRDGVIVEMGSRDDVRASPDAVVIDGVGRFLLPGLIDMHVHIQHPDELVLFAAHGVTTVRNMWGNQGPLRWMGFPDQRQLREQVAAGELLGPRIVTAGPILEGRPAGNPFMTVVETPEQASDEVAAQAAAGYDVIKTYDRIDPPVFAAVLDAAAQHGLTVAGHVPESVSIDRVLGRLHTIEYLTGYIDPDAARLLVPEAELPAVAAATAASGTWNVPTMVIWQIEGNDR